MINTQFYNKLKGKEKFYNMRKKSKAFESIYNKINANIKIPINSNRFSNTSENNILKNFINPNIIKNLKNTYNGFSKIHTPNKLLLNPTKVTDYLNGQQKNVLLSNNKHLNENNEIKKIFDKKYFYQNKSQKIFPKTEKDNSLNFKNPKVLDFQKSKSNEKFNPNINISPNINVEINPQNTFNDFNKIWAEIGNRLNSELNSSANGVY